MSGATGNVRQYRTFLCRECGGDREHALVGWNAATKPLWRCEQCNERQVGPLGSAVIDGGDQQ